MTPQLVVSVGHAHSNSRGKLAWQGKSGSFLREGHSHAGAMGSLGRLEVGDLSAVFGMFQAALQAKSSCIDSLQAVVARQSEELALSWASIEKERQARGVAEEGVKVCTRAQNYHNPCATFA